MKTPILLVPGLLCSARVFADQLPALWPYGPVTIANQLEGDSMASIARTILATAPPTFALVGFSMGGYLSFEIFRQAPARIQRLALIDTGARPDSPDHVRVRTERIEMVRQGKFEETVDMQYPLLVHRKRREDAELRALCLSMARETGADAFMRHQTAIMQRPDSRPDLAAISCPTLIMVGDSDRVTPPEFAAEMAAGIPRAKHIVIPECGHMSLLEQPEAINAALIDWISR